MHFDRTIVDEIEPGYLEHFLKVLKVSLNNHKDVLERQISPPVILDYKEIELMDFEEDDKYCIYLNY